MVMVGLDPGSLASKAGVLTVTPQIHNKKLLIMGMIRWIRFFSVLIDYNSYIIWLSNVKF